jgi:GDP-L-fucose synthase
LHVDDMADACLHLLDHYDGSQQVNVGAGRDATVKQIAALVADVVGFEGSTEWDASKPDGTPQKLLDISTLSAAGWRARIGLREGLESTVEWYRQHVGQLRE